MPKRREPGWARDSREAGMDEQEERQEPPEQEEYRFDPPDLEMIRLTARMSVG